MTAQSVLIITLPPLTGGVPDKARILIQHLRSLGHAVTVAHFATLSDYPDLVVPSWKILSARRPMVREGICFGDVPCLSIGCRFPELEFPYYLSSKRWQDVISEYDRHIVVTGTVLTANMIAKLGMPHLVWCAGTMIEDRIDRRQSMPLPRRLFDQTILSPILRVMEKNILMADGHFMAVSEYTRNSMVAVGLDDKKISKTPIPVDVIRFHPPAMPPEQGVIGFAGRPEDGRKNLSLLFSALKVLLDQKQNVSLQLTGSPSAQLTREIERLDLAEHVSWSGWLNADELPEFYQSLDVFVIPSLQEGLNMAGIQAMASGVPVVSTHCGGPEDYVIDGKTGSLVGFDAAEMAAAVAAIVSDRGNRDVLGANARHYVETNYSMDDFAKNISDSWFRVWGDRPDSGLS
ncbi:MAG: hypothetical protein CMM52_01510 [Rhodospirillaceae bacterium]|nr:hypothetical protein [Rhodospirillaceae bacterium]|tara:strand:+ start:5708 stop:6919 length:1212 start_codon:yes stop_codon:yes gene_type:complete